MAMVTAEMAKAVSRQIYQPAFRKRADMQHWGWTPLFTVSQSRAATEQTFGFTGIGAAVETEELEPAYYGKYEELGTTVWTHSKYTLGGMVSQELLEDNQNLPSIVGSLGEMIAEGHAYIVDYTVAQLFNRAFNVLFPLYDAVQLCGTHTLQKSGATVSNALAAASIDFDTLWLAINYFEYSMFTHENLPMTAVPKYLLFHPSQSKNVRKILETDRGEPDTADNNKNTLTSYGIIPIPCRFLTSTYWFLASEKFPADAIFYYRVRGETKEDADFDRDAIKLKTRQRFSAKFRDWPHIVGNPGA